MAQPIELKPGETYEFTTKVDGQAKVIGSFAISADQKALTLRSADPAAARPWNGDAWAYLELASWVMALVVVGGFGLTILVKFWRGVIDIKDIISEPDGKASLSRFQALLFTFVFVVSIALIVVRTGEFPTEIPTNLLLLLGGSLGTYLISKGMQLGLGGDAGALASFQPGGPVLRYGATAEQVMAGLTAEEAATKRQSSVGESRFLVPAGTNAFGPPSVVATAIGAVKLTIVAQAISGVQVKGRVRYRSAAGKDAVDDFEGETTIETAGNEMVEVRVEFNAGVANTTVPVIVRTAA